MERCIIDSAIERVADGVVERINWGISREVFVDNESGVTSKANIGDKRGSSCYLIRDLVARVFVQNAADQRRIC